MQGVCGPVRLRVCSLTVLDVIEHSCAIGCIRARVFGDWEKLTETHNRLGNDSVDAHIFLHGSHLLAWKNCISENEMEDGQSYFTLSLFCSRPLDSGHSDGHSLQVKLDGLSQKKLVPLHSGRVALGEPDTLAPSMNIRYAKDLDRCDLFRHYHGA